MATLDEQETTVTQLRNGDASIWTANPVHIRAQGFKTRRKPMTDEQRAIAVARFQRNVLGK